MSIMSDIPSVASTLKSILTPENNLDSAISNALMALGVALDKLTHQYDKAGKEIELVRRMTRTGWLMAINVPLPFGVTKCQALQQLLGKFDYCKPLFDSERDLICSEILYVNRGGLLCNMSFLVAQRHFDYIMSAPFQKRIVTYNQKLPRDQWISIGRVLTPNEKSDYDVACALKRLIISEMNARHKADPSYAVLFVLVDKKSLRLRIDKQYYNVDEAAARFSIKTEAIAEEKKRYAELTARTEPRTKNKRPASQITLEEGPSAKSAKH